MVLFLKCFSLITLYFITAGVISLLDDPMMELKEFSLKKLNDIVDDFWPEVSEAIQKM